nr:sugar transferase [Asticcacaulis currens]
MKGVLSRFATMKVETSKTMRNFDMHSGSIFGNSGPGDCLQPSLQSEVGMSVSKRMIDFLLAGLVLFFLLPALVFIALAIKLDSKGPVLFRQTRSGLNGKKFSIYKFRSMHCMEDGASVRQVVAGDARITAIGHFLRRSSLDELPQVINVLKGEMSLVGPRPHALVHDEMFAELVEGYEQRFLARPGLTGLAQIRGFRGEIRTPNDVVSRVRSDREYIRTWSLVGDFRIIVCTFFIVLNPEYRFK